MPFLFSIDCPVCGKEHGIDPSWSMPDVQGDHDCPKCGAVGAIHVEWETEYDLEPIDDDDE